MAKQTRQHKTDKHSKLATLRHSASHILAAVVVEMFPEAKLGIGPATEDGFYYDFELPRPLIPEDLPIIEAKMQELMAKDSPFEKTTVAIDDAINKSQATPQIYKTELMQDLKKAGEAQVTFYRSGEFVDLCEGPHIKSTKEIGAVKLLSLAGAYWRGDEHNPQLTRIYGTAFPTPAELDEYLAMLEEAKKRDHRKLGKDLELFFFDETSPGMPYWLPKGLIIYNKLIDFWRQEHQARGYQEIKSPLINKKELYVTSGHWDHYRKEMFICDTEEHETYALKPMNCPNAMVAYKSRPHSYKEFPLRLSDCDSLHRYELSGVINGLLRVREFSQDDAHIFLREDQIENEYKNIFEIIKRFYSIFDLNYSFRLSTRPDDSMGDIETWAHAENILENILKKLIKTYTVVAGEGAFYGPKIDIMIKDSMGREWQTGTIQLDFQLPKNFNLKYIDEFGKENHPVVIHRVIYGSLERFIGILTEHCAGIFPFWLTPVQAIILPVSDKFNAYAQTILAQFVKKGYRVDFDDRNESLGRKIRDAELKKIPFMLVVGEKEVATNSVTIRQLQSEEQLVKTIPETIKLFRKQRSPLKR